MQNKNQREMNNLWIERLIVIYCTSCALYQKVLLKDKGGKERNIK